MTSWHSLQAQKNNELEEYLGVDYKYRFVDRPAAIAASAAEFVQPDLAVLPSD